MCMCVIAVFHMHVFESVQWSGSRFFSGTSIAVTLYCLDMILALFKIECAEALLALRAFGRKNKGGVWMWHFDCTLNTQCPLFCFLSSSFASFFNLLTYSLYPLFTLTSVLFLPRVHSSGAGGLQNEGGSGDLGGGALQQWLHASRYGTFHSWLK